MREKLLVGTGVSGLVMATMLYKAGCIAGCLIGGLLLACLIVVALLVWLGGRSQ